MFSENQRRSKILIVDDEPILRETLHALLIEDLYDFCFGSNGEEGISQAESAQPDVILLDVMMPGMDGFEACQFLKNNPLTSQIPIILVTALDSSEDISRGLDSGADEFITKPPDRRELKARVRSMLRIKHQYDDLKNTLKLREDLANLIVHDMRSPLNIIIGHGEMLLNAPGLSEALVRRVDKINEQAEKLNKFIDEMLMIARMEQGKIFLNRNLANINQIVEHVVAEHSVIAEARRLKLVVEMPPLICHAQVDERLVARVLDNLLSNAFKFSPSLSTVSVRMTLVEHAAQSFIRLQVIDQGPGISDDYKAEIFDKFKVVQLKKAGVSQVGLGLFFCRMVIEAHEGHIWVEDNIPLGSIFNFEIPAESPDSQG
jgi:two-component system, sensor histidine kinase and response regulator